MNNFKITRTVFSQLLFVCLAFFFMVFISNIFVSNIVRGYLAKEAENTLSYTRSRIAADLREAETVLQTVSQSILVMILRGDSAEVIHEHMIEITNYLSSDDVRISALDGVYGFFEVFGTSESGGLFLDGSGWIPPEDYVPQERPWYKVAIEAGGGIASTTPYISLYPGAAVVSYSRLIHDKEGKSLGVVSLDIRLDKMAEYVVNTRLTEGGFGMLISEYLEIVATLSKEHIGKHLSELPDKGVLVAVDDLKNGIDVFEHIVRDDNLTSDFVLFTKRLENGWHIGIFTPIDKYYRQVTNMSIFIAILGVVLAFALSLVLLRIARAKQKADEESLEAKTASKAKDEFLATMSHEMRTPLNAIIGLSEIELHGSSSVKLPESSRDNITQIHRSGTTLLEIINDILDISKIEAGRFELFPVMYDTASMLNDTVILSRVRIGSMPINFALEIDGSFPGKLVGDELRVKQILNNLLSNAVKYTKQGTVTLSVSCELNQTGQTALAKQTALAEQTALLRLCVQDTGIGIREEDMGRLFSSYTQLDTGAKRKTEGTGLGLTIVKNLTEIMGGGITVKSEYGKGSCFTAEIIQGIDNVQPIGNETAKNLKTFHYLDAKENEKINFLWLPEAKALVVDDLPANLKVTMGLLAPYGIQVDTVVSGKKAVEMVKELPKRKYDIIFMDHMMPEMDGVETAAAIRSWEKEQNEKEIPIIAMTANAIRGVREYYLANGFDDYLSKPIIPRNLHEIITKWIKTPDEAKLSAPCLHKSLSDLIPHSLASLLTEQRIDILKHYRLTFGSGREIDSEYYVKFAAFINSLDGELTDAFREQTDLLTESCRKEDGHTIRRILPAFCDTLQLWHEQKQAQAAANNKQETEQKALGEMFERMEIALLAGDTKTADAILGEMGTLELTDTGRELYIRLYDLMFEDKTEKALELIKEQTND